MQFTVILDGRDFDENAIYCHAGRATLDENAVYCHAGRGSGCETNCSTRDRIVDGTEFSTTPLGTVPDSAPSY